MTTERPRAPGERVFAWFMLAASLFFLWQAYQISGFAALSSPGAVPMAAALAMVVAAGTVLAGDLRRPRPAQADKRPAPWRRVMPPVVILFAALILLYALLLEPLGFLPASLLFLVTAFGCLHRAGPLRAVALAVLALAAIYVVFRLVFQVLLPEGIVPERAILAWFSSLISGG